MCFSISPLKNSQNFPVDAYKYIQQSAEKRWLNKYTVKPGEKTAWRQIRKDQTNNLSIIETAEIRRRFAEISHYREYTGSIKIPTWPVHEGYTREKPNLSMVTMTSPLSKRSISKAQKMTSLVEFFQQLKLSRDGPITTFASLSRWFRMESCSSWYQSPQWELQFRRSFAACMGSGSDEGEIEEKKSF